MVDYGFYAGTYGGSSIPAAAFDSYIRAADAHLERYRQIYTLSPRREDGEKMALCAMADALYYFDFVQNGGLAASVSVGSVSCSRAQTSLPDTSPAAQSRELYRCAGLYLDINRRA